MYAMAIRFPRSFLRSLTFIICGENGNQLAWHFNDIQDLEMHLCNLGGKARDKGEIFYGKYLDQSPITGEEFREFLELDPELCELVDCAQGDEPVGELMEKYPDALFRPAPEM